MSSKTADSGANEKKVVLIVDGDPQIRRLLAKRLERHFDEVAVATDAGEAFTAARFRRITHVVSGYRLGGDLVDGVQLIADLKHRFPKIERAILLTEADVAREALSDGVDAVVPKTRGIDAVIAALSEKRSP